MCVWLGIRTGVSQEVPRNWLLLPTGRRVLRASPWVRRSDGESGRNFANFAVGEGEAVRTAVAAEG